MGLARWRHLVDVLGVDLQAVLDRAAVLDPYPPPIGDLFKGLKLSRPHRPLYGFQSPLLQWSKEVHLDSAAPRLEIDRDTCSKAEQDLYFEKFKKLLERLAVQSPEKVHFEDASLLAEGLLKACYRMQYQSVLDDAVDCLTIALRLQEKTKDFRALAMGYRSGAYIALDLGRIDIANLVLQRSRELDLWSGSIHGFSLTLHAESLMCRLSGNSIEALKLSMYCLDLSKRGYSSLRESWLHVFLANICAELGDIRAAKSFIESAAGEFVNEGAVPKAEFLSTKAEILSRSGLVQDATELFEEASRLLTAESNPRDLALIGLAKCKHLLCNRLSTQARKESAKLLRISSYLEKNPIGRLALQEMVASTLAGTIDEMLIRETRQRLMYPNLSRGAARGSRD